MGLVGDYFSKAKKELNVLEACRRWGIPLWQCPEAIFIAIGFLAVIFIGGSYLLGQQKLEPEQMVAVASGIAIVFLAAAFIIVNSFERMAEANRLKSEFLNITSHQLRTPLTAARWALSLLVAAPNVGKENQRHMAILEEAIGRMRRMVTTMLEVARIEAGTIRRMGRRLSLRDLVSTIAAAFSDFAYTSNITLRYIAPNDPVEVMADEEQIRYVLESLLDNAFRYTSGKGTVSISLSQEGSTARIAVSDTGAGVPDKDQQRVFNKFFRGANILRISPGGMGLSLFVSRAVIEAAHGTMGFLSQEGSGSTFWFTIPLVKSEPPLPPQNQKVV